MKGRAKGKRAAAEVVVIAECIGCHKRREIRGGEVPPGETPMCKDCFMPMVAKRAVMRSVGKVRG